MKELFKHKRIVIAAIVLAISATVATLMVLSGCTADAKEGIVPETDAIFETDEKEGADVAEDEAIELACDGSTYYSFRIGKVGNENDPLYKDAVAFDKSEKREVYLHTFESRAQTKEFLLRCSREKNYYVQDLANAIYCYGDDFYNENRVYLALVKQWGDGEYYAVDKVKTQGNKLCLSISEHTFEDYYKVTTYTLLAFTLDKNSISEINEYSFDYKVVERNENSSTLIKRPKTVKLGFDTGLDYTTREVEYSVKSVYTGLAFEATIRDSALNVEDFIDKITLHLPVHTFDDRESMLEFWRAYDYPADKRAEVEAFLNVYDDAFFETNTLITLWAVDYGSDTSYKITGIRTQANTMLIETAFDKKGEVCSSGKDGQIIGIAVKRSDVAGCYNFKAPLAGMIREVETQPPCFTATYVLQNDAPMDGGIYKNALNAKNLEGQSDSFEKEQQHRNLPIYRFESQEELKKVFGDYGITAEGTDWISKYDDAFFEENTLFTVYLRSYSSEADYEISSLYVTDFAVNLTYKKTAHDGESAGNGRLTVIELPKKYGRADYGHASVTDGWLG